MPVDRNGVGTGPFTHHKLEQFTYIMDATMGIVKGILVKKGRPPAFHYWDLYAGPGYSAGMPGSPLITARLAQEHKLSLNGWFFEYRAANAAALAQNLAGHGARLHIIEGDNREKVPQVMAGFRAESGLWRYGIVYVDSNGKREIPVEMIRTITDVPCFAAVDVMLYVGATYLKRGRAQSEIQHVDPRPLEEQLRAVGKRHIFVREQKGYDQWTFVILTNWNDFPRFAKLGMHHIDTPTGRALMDVLSWTKEERLVRYQPTLDYETYEEYLRHPKFLAVRKRVMERAGGICERCRKRPATQPHHLRYPVWGTFDVPENLLAVCRPCHAAIHGKER